MTGWRSGRPRTGGSVEACQVLDVNGLNRRGHLPTPPADETWIQVRMRDADGNWQTVTQYVRVERVSGRFRFGGSRAYFRCWCDRRAEKLYQPGYGFCRCRQCHHLAYESEREDDSDRASRAAGKIKERLGGDPDILAPFPLEPKDMWSCSYLRLWSQYLEAEERADEASTKKLRGCSAVQAWATIRGASVLFRGPGTTHRGTGQGNGTPSRGSRREREVMHDRPKMGR